MKQKSLLRTMLLLFALIVGVGSVWAEDVTDVITASNLAATGTTYTDFSNVSITSDAVYAGNSAKNDNNIQMRSKNSNSGIVSTTSGGKLKSVKITVASGTNTIDVYGSNTAYTSASDLYATGANSKQGTKLGSVTETGTITVTGDYAYVGIRSNNGAIYISKIEITWEKESSNLTLSDLTLTDAPVALSFDLYNNSSAQTINYTTSSTGAITVSASEYVETSVNTTNKTITVTPTAVTPETQTITVSQAADETYAAGSVTFTVTITNSDPNVPGTQTNPYTVAQARAAIDAGTGTQGVYATGIVSEIVTAYNSTYSNVTFDIVDEAETSVSLRAYRCVGNEAANVAVGDIVVVSGNLTKYGNTYEFAEGCQIVSRTHPTIPIINADDVEIEYDATSGEIPYTINNPVDGVSLTATTTAEWISNVTVASDKVTFTTTANEGDEDRTATITLSYEGAADKSVTVTQKHYVIDFATLPFEWAGGASADLLELSGVTANGLGSDYASGNAPYLIKFDNTDDYIQIKTDSQPAMVTVGVKMIGGSNTSTITVQGSSDGETFANVEVLTISGAQNAVLTLETTKTFSTDTRYVRLLFTKGSNVGVGLITITKATNDPSISLSTSTIEAPASETEGTITVTYNNIASVDAEVLFFESDGVTTAQYSWLLADINNDNNIDYIIDDNNGEARTAYMKVHQKNTEVYSELITITQAAYVPPFVPATYTLASSITSGKHYIIVGEKDVTQAMAEQKTNNRNAVNVTKDNDKITTVQEVTEFVIYGPDADGYYTIFDAKNDGYLYAASSSANNLKTHTDYTGDARWEITFDNESGAASIVAKGSNTHNVMLYNSGSNLFSCYESASQNPVYLYEKDDEAAPTESVTVSSVSYATYSSEKALNFSNTGITVYTAIANGTSVSLTPIENDGIVPAYTGVVLYANGGASATVPVATSTSGTTWTDNEMVANVKRAKVYLTEGNKTNYILSNEKGTGVGFYLAASGGAYLPANRAYLSTTTTATGTGNAPFLGFEGGETTAIQNIQPSTLNAQQYYDLSGRRVAQPTKGLYIVNGKKVLVP